MHIHHVCATTQRTVKQQGVSITNIYPHRSRWSHRGAASGGPGTGCLIIDEARRISYRTCFVKAGVDFPLSYLLPSTIIVKTPSEDMLVQEHSHLTSPSTPQKGTRGLLMGIGGERWEGRGVNRCQCFQPDAAAVTTDDASARSAATSLNDQLRTLRFLDIQVGCGAACFRSPAGPGAAAERLGSNAPQ